MVEILAVDVKSDPPYFDEEDRMPRPEDILRLCGSLVSTSTALDSRKDMDDVAEIRHFTAAHASVVDFLHSGRVRIGSETVASFTKAAANLEMAETCLVYLLHFVERENLQIEKDVPNYPFARLSAKMWHTFYREVLKDSGHQELGKDRLRNLVIRLLTDPESVSKWVQLCGLRTDFRGRLTRDTTPRNIMPAMYYAAALGLHDIVDCLIKGGHDVDGGKIRYYRTPLGSACRHGREKVVSVLLNNGADPNWSVSCRERPLATAMVHGHAEVVDILLNAKDIDVNDRNHHPLVSYDLNCYLETTYDESFIRDTWDSKDARGILEYGYCHPGSQCQPLISIAAACGSLDFVKALIAAGADVNIQGGSEGTAMEIACHQGRVDLVRCLLESGANLNLQSDFFGGPLQAACVRQSIAVVKILLNAGADINLKGGCLGTALVAACLYGKNADLVRLLLDRGADPNISECSDYENALYTACLMGKPEIVSLLLQRGADPNIDCGRYGSPLHTAFSVGDKGTIDMLLQRGADSNYEGGLFRTVVKAAIKSRKTATIQRALELDLSANEKAGWLTCPLLPGNALKDSLELLSKELSHQENERVRKAGAKRFTIK